MRTDPTRIRLAVATRAQDDELAPRLGRAVKFALFDAYGKDIRGPFYRVRHGEPGTDCMEQSELAEMLHDCQVVIAGAVGPRVCRRLKQFGISTVATTESLPAAQLVARHLAGTLRRKRS